MAVALTTLLRTDRTHIEVLLPQNCGDEKKSIEKWPVPYEEVIMMKTEVKEELQDFQIGWDEKDPLVIQETDPLVIQETDPLAIQETDAANYFLLRENKIKLISEKKLATESLVDFVCSFCEQEISNEKSYEGQTKQCEKHCLRANEKEDVSIDIQKILHSEKWKEDLNLTNKNLFKHDTCEFTTIRENHLKNHSLSKHREEEKKYKCRYCIYCTHRKHRLIVHERVHANERLFKCDTCEYAAVDRSNLNKHTLLRHSNKDKRYKCTHCNYSTHQKQHLESHIGIHTNEKLFKCDTCKYAATSGSNLNKHILSKHSNEDKQYKCGDCKYSTHIKHRLVVHERIHSNERPFKCDKCEYAAVDRSNLNKHILLKHSDKDKRYKCRDCIYSTHIKRSLALHVRRIHTKEKPFKQSSSIKL